MNEYQTPIVNINIKKNNETLYLKCYSLIYYDGDLFLYDYLTKIIIYWIDNIENGSRWFMLYDCNLTIQKECLENKRPLIDLFKSSKIKILESDFNYNFTIQEHLSILYFEKYFPTNDVTLGFEFKVKEIKC